MTFLVLVLLGNILPWASRGKCVAWRQWLVWGACLGPWSWAAYVATSRIVDNWHHPSDVIAGTFIGIACAVISYHSVFPHVMSSNVGVSFVDLVERKKR